MAIRNYIRDIFIIMAIVNLVLFTFLLARKILIKIVDRKKGQLRELYEAEILSFISTGKMSDSLMKKHFISKVVIKEIILDYSHILKGQKKEDLINLLDRAKMIKSVRSKLKSRNKWKQRIGAYEVGEFNLHEAIGDLIVLVDSHDKELVYVASSSLLKVGGSSYICRVLNRCLHERIIEKSNILYLIDTLDKSEDIEGILLNLMDKESNFLKSVALESCGKRQYRRAIEWMLAGLEDPDKEIKVSSLKGALYFNEFPYIDNLELFISLKNSSDWEVRLFLAKNLGKVDDLEATQLLKELMRDENWFVRNASGLTLLRKGSDGILALVDTLRSDDRFASQKAREILEREIIQKDLIKNIENKDLVKTMMDNMGITMLEEPI